MTKTVEYTRTDDAVIAVVGKHTITLNFSEVHADVIKPLVLRGVSDKTRDRHAGAGAKELTADEIADLIRESFQNFRDGIFNAGRSGVSGATILAEAIARVQGISIVDAKAVVAKLDDEQMKAVNKHPKIAKAVLEIKAERADAAAAATTVDLSELLKL